MSSFLKGVANAPREIAATIRRKPVQALVWFSCWSCWTLASMQYYALPFTISNLAKYLKVEQDKISYANTTSMLSRSVGAAIFGVLADQFGRKIPLLADLVLLGVFSMCSGFIHTYGQLIGVRVLFGKWSRLSRPASSMLMPSRCRIRWDLWLDYVQRSRSRSRKSSRSRRWIDTARIRSRIYALFGIAS